MMTRVLPWDEIRTPERDYNVRRLPLNGGIPLYWGKDTVGRCLFLLELDGDYRRELQGRDISVHGIQVDLRLPEDTRKQNLVFTLHEQVDKDLFYGLCDTLAVSLSKCQSPAEAFHVAIAHLKRWKRFFSGRSTRLLSQQEIRGLFAELQFLRFLYQKGMSEHAAVDAWCGPEGLNQDFIFGNTAVEIKALSGRERNSVRMSSEDQLESTCDRLFLNVFRVADAPEGQGESLNELVQGIEQELTDGAALEEFFGRLAVAGYVELREYDEPRLLVAGRHSYRVEGDFPRIVRSELKEGLVRVNYDIEIEAMASFECNESAIWGEEWN